MHFHFILLESIPKKKKNHTSEDYFKCVICKEIESSYNLKILNIYHVRFFFHTKNMHHLQWEF